MTFKTSELRAFLNAASRIKTNTLMPVLCFIRFQDGTITKNALHSFVQYTCEFTGTWLIEERLLQTFVNSTISDEVIITWTDEKVMLYAGDSKLQGPNEDIKNFPVNDQSGVELKLPEGATDAIGIAAQMLTDDESAHPRCRHIFVGNKIIAGVDGWVGYLQDFTYELPQIMLSKHVAQIVSRLDQPCFSQNESYHFFREGFLLYGFSKPECTWMDMGILRCNNCFPVFSVDKFDLIRFCENCLAASPLNGIVATMEKKDVLMLRFSDVGFGVEIEKRIECEGDEAALFRFQPKLLLRMLKALPVTEVKAWRGERCYYFTGENFQSQIQTII